MGYGQIPNLTYKKYFLLLFSLNFPSLLYFFISDILLIVLLPITNPVTQLGNHQILFDLFFSIAVFLHNSFLIFFFSSPSQLLF